MLFVKEDEKKRRGRVRESFSGKEDTVLWLSALASCGTLCRVLSVLPITYQLHQSFSIPQQETPGSSYLLILLLCPRPFHQLRVEHLLPAVLTLAICPPLWHRQQHKHTSHLVVTTPTEHLCRFSTNFHQSLQKKLADLFIKVQLREQNNLNTEEKNAHQARHAYRKETGD